jgi:hypothetical protein
MWIRSQDKEKLIKVTCIYLCGENHICASSVEYDRWYIGKYSTKEKALKVLDKIQKRINRAFMYDYQPGGVFQMPQDDEVEEKQQYIKKIEEAAKDKNFIKRTINSQKDFDAIDTEVSEEW